MRGSLQLNAPQKLSAAPGSRDPFQKKKNKKMGELRCSLQIKSQSLAIASYGLQM